MEAVLQLQLQHSSSSSRYESWSEEPACCNFQSNGMCVNGKVNDWHVVIVEVGLISTMDTVDGNGMVWDSRV